MKKLALVIFVFLLVVGVSPAQVVDKTVENIRRIYTDVSEKAKAAETDDKKGEIDDLVMNELTINKRNHQWRAVGIYVLTFKFFYRNIDESVYPPEIVENHLYPDQLAKVAVEKRISGRNYLEEFIYDNRGALIFYFQKAENDDQVPLERRIYFSAGKPVRIIEDGNIRDKLKVSDLKTAQDVAKSNLRIKELFTRSLAL